MHRLDFPALNQAAGHGAWNNTFAYWLSILNRNQAYAPVAEEACALMSFQYDVEEQAKDAEMLIGKPELIPSVFVPVAPVTLAHSWSPFPAAMAALGQPNYFDTEKGDVIAVFTPIAEPKSVGLTLDAKHFDFLLQHACGRALYPEAYILLVGSPGWDYDSEDFLEEQPEIQKLMRDFGFAYTLRKPASTQSTRTALPISCA